MLILSSPVKRPALGRQTYCSSQRQFDVMTLDIEMPEMDGVSYLKSLHDSKHPPVVMLSSLTFEDGNRGLKRFEFGAVDYLEKPSSLDLFTKSEEIRSVLKGAASSRVQSGKVKFLGVIQYAEPPGEKEIIALGAWPGDLSHFKWFFSNYLSTRLP